MTRPASSPAANPAPSPVGSILKQWRGLRGLSQLDLAHDANTSARHLSFVETGRTRPSREMVQRFAEALDMPLRERNALLTAAGFAAVYRREAARRRRHGAGAARPGAHPQIA